MHKAPTPAKKWQQTVPSVATLLTLPHHGSPMQTSAYQASSVNTGEKTMMQNNILIGPAGLAFNKHKHWIVYAPDTKLSQVEADDKGMWEALSIM